MGSLKVFMSIFQNEDRKKKKTPFILDYFNGQFFM